MEGVIDMIDQEKLEEITESLKEESFVLVVFNGVGSVMKAVAMSNVIPEQILELGSELELMGKNGIVQQSNQPPPKPKIEVPNPRIKL